MYVQISISRCYITYHNIWVDFRMSNQHFDNIRPVHLNCLGEGNMAWGVKSKLEIRYMKDSDSILCTFTFMFGSTASWSRHSSILVTLPCFSAVLWSKELTDNDNLPQVFCNNTHLLINLPESCIKFQIPHFNVWLSLNLFFVKSCK